MFEQRPSSNQFSQSSPSDQNQENERQPNSLLRTLQFSGVLLAGLSLSGCSFFERAKPDPAPDTSTTTPSQPEQPAAQPEEHGITIDNLKQQLATTGLNGTVHGADHADGLYVFVYRDPQDFFHDFYFSMTTKDAAIRETLAQLERNDRVHVKGELTNHRTPQPHLRLSELTILREFNPELAAPAGEVKHSTDLPAELRGKTEMVAMVHGVREGGKVVLLEYKDALIPMVVQDPTFTKDLYRGDRIKVHFEVRSFPGRPTHISLDTDLAKGEKPVEVLDAITVNHAQQVTVEGRLVLFPKSPTINRDIWAVEEPSKDGGPWRYFTIVPDTKDLEALPEEEQMKRMQERFDEFDAKLRVMWNSSPDGVFKARNKYVNTEVSVSIKGIFNVVDPNQANAQIFTSLDGISAPKH